MRLAGLLLALGLTLGLWAEETRPVRVALYDDIGVGKGVKEFHESLKKLPGLKVTLVKAAEIQNGILKDFDILIQPGGSGGGQGKALEEKGRENIRQFVKVGGGYLGICAGAYLATCDYDWSLHLLDAKVIDKKHWARGFGPVEVGFSSKGSKLLGLNKDKATIYYHQGPLLAPANNPLIPDYENLATFESELAKNGAPKGVMVGTTAVTASTFEKGRVFCFSPHPEKTEGRMDMVLRAILWTAGRNAKE